VINTPASPTRGLPADAPIPRQIRYIIGNEGCERFSFYGMRNILTVFLVSSLLLYLPEADGRMPLGIAFSGLSWIVVGAMQLVLDRGTAFTITWQVLPYALLTFGEVLVSATGLEFAYSQAPLPMKSAIMAFWSLSVTIGNLWVLVVKAGVQNARVIDFIKASGFGVTAFQMFFFAAFAFAAALLFGLVARTYPVADHYRTAS